MISGIFKNILGVLSGRKKFTMSKFKNYLKFLTKRDSLQLKDFTNPQPFEGPQENAVDKNALLHRTFKNHDNYMSVKWEQYLSIYEKIFSPFLLKGKPLDILEIGILNGGFIEILEKLFPKGSKITGVDINKKCADLKYSDNIKILLGDATKKDFIEKKLKDSKFDIIIDDASHLCQDVISTFSLTFDKLKPGGIYVIEDCHTSYWPDYYGGFRQNGSIMEYFKNLTDSLNFYYIDKREVKEKELNMLKKFNSSIASISFYDSVIVLEKYTVKKDKPFRNYLAGKKDYVMPKSEYLKDGCIECDENTKFENFFEGN